MVQFCNFSGGCTNNRRCRTTPVMRSIDWGDIEMASKKTGCHRRGRLPQNISMGGLFPVEKGDN